MDELYYLLKVGSDAKDTVAKRLRMKKAPSYVRLSTLAPLSNYGFPAGSEGAVVDIGAEGVVLGADGAEAPAMLVPWQNVAYLADGTSLAKEMKKK